LVRHDLKLERLFGASPEIVLGGFTALQAQKELYADTPGWIVESERDLRVGGRWTIGFGPPRTPPAWETNLFQVVDWPRRSTMTLPDGSSVDTGIEVTFRERDRRARVTIVQGGFPVAWVRDEFAGGWASIPDGLGRTVAARVTDRL
jgi:uncharacterized protein YndB with AHSA1/START domain